MINDGLMALGALGLILLGMEWMTLGLKKAAGNNLVTGLQRWTGRPLQGLAIGTFATVAVQSSTAVTVTTIGFVNANLVSLRNAAYVIYGSNVGTSFTGWFVALVGLQFKIDALALPLIGVGILLKSFVKSRVWQGSGQGVAGFGLMFLGIGLLKTSFDAAFVNLEFGWLVEIGIWGLLLAVLIGALLTTVMQASAAVIALVITAVASGVVPLSLGAAFVIGSNLGTTSTAILSALAATAKAKRLAMLHLIFNVITAIVALLLLQPLLWLLLWLQYQLFDVHHAAFSLALFHTLFNLLGVLLMWPISDRLVLWLNGRFRRQPSDRLRMLDQSSLAIPALALKTLTMEQQHQVQQLCRLAANLAHKPLDRSALDELRQLQRDIASFTNQLGQQPLQSAEAQLLNRLAKSQLRFELLLQMLPQLEHRFEQQRPAIQSQAEFWRALAALDLPAASGQISVLYRDISRKRVEQKQQLLTPEQLSSHLHSGQGGELLLRLAELRRFDHHLTKCMLSIAQLQNAYEQQELLPTETGELHAH